jgi:hypothetical protein
MFCHEMVKQERKESVRAFKQQMSPYINDVRLSCIEPSCHFTIPRLCYVSAFDLDAQCNPSTWLNPLCSKQMETRFEMQALQARGFGGYSVFLQPALK